MPEVRREREREKMTREPGGQLFPAREAQSEGMLTICCREVDSTATQAQMKPFALTFTSVTVHTPTPMTTTTTAILTSRE